MKVEAAGLPLPQIQQEAVGQYSFLSRTFNKIHSTTNGSSRTETVTTKTNGLGSTTRSRCSGSFSYYFFSTDTGGRRSTTRANGRFRRSKGDGRHRRQARLLRRNSTFRRRRCKTAGSTGCSRLRFVRFRRQTEQSSCSFGCTCSFTAFFTSRTFLPLRGSRGYCCFGASNFLSSNGKGFRFFKGRRGRRCRFSFGAACGNGCF